MDGGTIKKDLQQHRTLLLIGGPLLFLLIAGYFYLTSGRFISTDDAYIQAARTEISANVSGRIVAIAVRDNQVVRKGDLLYKIDDRDFVNAVNDAAAKLANAKLQVSALKATYKQKQAELQTQVANLAYWQGEYKRQQLLAESGISSQQQLDEARKEYTAAKQNYAATHQDAESTLVELNNNPNIELTDHPTVRQAQAILDQAELNLSYTIVTAAQDGIVSKVEQLQVGDYINSATPVFALVSDKDIWVEANYKETELTYMKSGQKATFTVDAYPDDTFHGHVVSLSPGTGSSFALLPPENATGNWVKVVQRLPVRISVDDADPKKPLRMGFSVIVDVDTHYSRIYGEVK